MKMKNLLLLAVVSLASIELTAAATLTPCALSYLTSDRTGMAETANPTPTRCATTTYKTDCAGGFNAQCTFSLKYYYYICCYPIAATVAAPIGTATSATLEPGSTRSPNNLRPICPSGTIGFGSNSVALTCNNTNLANAGCPSTYTCTKALNVYDVSGTPTNFMDDIGAAKTPYACCKTITATNVFSAAGLGTTVIPVPPTNNVLSVRFMTTPAAVVYLGDDYSTTGISYLANPPNTAFQLQQITLYTATALATASGTAGARYHVLMFDSTTNKDCIFIGNIPGGTTSADSPNPTLTIPALAAPAVAAVPADGQAAMVYLDSTTTPATPTYKYSPGTTYRSLASLMATAAHKWVVLVWYTAGQLNFGAAATTAADETRILLGSGTYGDLAPTTDPVPGKFTTVTAFLNLAKVKTILGTPIAGTYFYMKN